MLNNCELNNDLWILLIILFLVSMTLLINQWQRKERKKENVRWKYVCLSAVFFLFNEYI